MKASYRMRSIRLRALDYSDADAAAGIIDDADVRRFMKFFQVPTTPPLIEAQRWIARSIQENQERVRFTRAIEDAEGAFIGAIGAIRVSGDLRFDNRWELGYFV